MKVITANQGSCLIHFSPDEVAPPVAVLSRDLVGFLAEEFKFSLRPDLPPGLLTEPQFTFQSGEVNFDKKKYPINQLNIVTGALIVTAKDTDTAETVATIIAKKIDETFGYKIAKNIRLKEYVSFLTVEFDPSVEKQFAAIGRVKAVLEKEIPRPSEFPFDLKRLAFGSAEKSAAALMLTIDGVRAIDFVIERRANEPHSTNRYFSSAPVKTSDHERILALIEEAWRS